MKQNFVVERIEGTSQVLRSIETGELFLYRKSKSGEVLKNVEAMRQMMGAAHAIQSNRHR